MECLKILKRQISQTSVKWELDCSERKDKDRCTDGMKLIDTFLNF